MLRAGYAGIPPLVFWEVWELKLFFLVWVFIVIKQNSRKNGTASFSFCSKKLNIAVKLTVFHLKAESSILWQEMPYTMM